MIPLGPEIDPTVRYGANPGVGKLSGLLVAEYGRGVSAALEGMEVGAYTTSGDKAPGAAWTVAERKLVTGVFRFRDEAAARAAVDDQAVFETDKEAGTDPSVPKVPLTLAGHPDAKAFSKTTSYSTSRVGLVASGRYVLASWTNGPVDWITKFFDLQIPAMKNFEPTPLHLFSTLVRDHDDLLKYTVAEATPTIFEATFTPRTMTAMQTDITAAAKDFADSGVDYIAKAGNTVYRAKDEAGAQRLAERFVAETLALREGATTSTVRGTSGARCLTYPMERRSRDNETYCVVPVGRYLAEVTDIQKARAEQAIGASYLILQGAR